MKEVFIYDAVRTPRGRGRKDGSLHEVTALALSTTVLNNIKKRNELHGHYIEDVIWGNVTQIGEQGACLARTAVLASELDENVPGISINRFCASGLEAVNLAANQIRGGAGNCYIAGGVESMSRVPMSSDGGAVAVDPSFTMNNYFVPQGISADLIATKYGFSRDQADELAVESQKRASIAWNEDRFSKSIVPVTDINGLTILEHDEYIRADTDMQKMPGFDKVALMKYPEIDKIHHIHHAGNSSGIVDGAAGILIGDEDFGKARGLKPRAKIRATCKVGTEPTIMLTGPVPATNKILSDSGLTISDIDLFEVNEAFASIVLMFEQAFKVNHDQVNVNGGAIAMGHPLGATGAMILGTLLDELERQDKTIGLATLCVASGMGAATIIERV